MVKSILPPKELSDLSGLSPQGTTFAARHIFTASGERDHIGYSLQMNAIRLSDLCIREYGLARTAILEYHSNGTGFGFEYIMNASGHLEVCIWSLERFINHVDALRSAPSASMLIKSLVPRDEPFIKKAVRKQISDLRNCLAHLECDAMNGDLPQGANLALLPSEEGLEVGKYSITWTDLVIWLSAMHACAVRLANFDSNAGSKSESAA